MNERLLQFIWQFQYFNKENLVTTENVDLTVLHPGRCNINQGPDFSEAKIRLYKTTWAGNVEIHVKASDWHLHRHTDDRNYTNVILHVVWINDKPLMEKQSLPVATLELQPRVSKIMLEHYNQLITAKSFVPCETHLPLLSTLNWLAWKERLVAERLQRKAMLVLEQLNLAGHHWEEVFWWLLAKNFGTKVNAAPFGQMARTIPVNILGKQHYQLNQLEALLFGQCLLLNGPFEEDYPRMLQREYRFLVKKYRLQPINQAPHFLRMRPANFPTVRLAQLAALIFKSSRLFSVILETGTAADLNKLLTVTANDYWHYHYIFGETSAYKPKELGSAMMENIIINTIVPVLFAYGVYHNNQHAKDKAVDYLTQLSPEVNSILKQWQYRGVTNKNAFDSQALIELKNNYCSEKHCLQCAVGNKLLRPG